MIYLVTKETLGKMAHPNLHAKSSAKKFGGKPEDYIHLHEWLDEFAHNSGLLDMLGHKDND